MYRRYKCRNMIVLREISLSRVHFLLDVNNNHKKSIWFTWLRNLKLSFCNMIQGKDAIIVVKRQITIGDKTRISFNNQFDVRQKATRRGFKN